jgi:glycosyltransferase involved in cell wall biosynthesis
MLLSLKMINQLTPVAPISAVVVTFNEEINIEDCLKSIVGWCQAIFVVDSGSTDNTIELCHRYTDLIYTHPFIDSASQWEWALQNLPLKTEWVLPMDADCRITPLLREQLVAATINPKIGVDGYYTRHQYFFWGVAMRGVKTYNMRLFKPAKVELDHSELVDFRFVVQGKTEVLSGATNESNKKEDVIDFWIDKQQKFSTRLAIEEILRAQAVLSWSIHPNLFGNYDQRIIWLKNRWYQLPLFIRPLLYFSYRYFFKLGFLTGSTGLIFHFLHAFWFRLLVDLKIQNLRRQLASGEITIEQLKTNYAHHF